MFNNLLAPLFSLFNIIGGFDFFFHQGIEIYMKLFSSKPKTNLTCYNSFF